MVGEDEGYKGRWWEMTIIGEDDGRRDDSLRG